MSDLFSGGIPRLGHTVIEQHNHSPQQSTTIAPHQQVSGAIHFGLHDGQHAGAGERRVGGDTAAARQRVLSFSSPLSPSSLDHHHRDGDIDDDDDIFADDIFATPLPDTAKWMEWEHLRDQPPANTGAAGTTTSTRTTATSAGGEGGENEAQVGESEVQGEDEDGSLSLAALLRSGKRARKAAKEPRKMTPFMDKLGRDGRAKLTDFYHSFVPGINRCAAYFRLYSKADESIARDLCSGNQRRQAQAMHILAKVPGIQGGLDRDEKARIKQRFMPYYHGKATVGDRVFNRGVKMIPEEDMDTLRYGTDGEFEKIANKIIYVSQQDRRTYRRGWEQEQRRKGVNRKKRPRASKTTDAVEAHPDDTLTPQEKD